MKKSRLAAAAIAVLLPLTVGCSSSNDNTKADSTPTRSSSTPSTPTTPSTSATPSTPSTAPTSTPGAGDRLAGTGYSVLIPKGWQDITAALQQKNPTLDIAIQSADTGSFRTNFNVIHSGSTVAPISSSDPELRNGVASELNSITNKPVKQIADRTIANELAIGQTSTYTVSGQSVTFIQYFTVHQGHPFPITLTFATNFKAPALAALNAILASWQWAD